MKLGGGTLALSGTLANSIGNGPRVKQGTLLLNKLPGVTALKLSGATVSVGDDAAGSTATVRFGAGYQIANTNNSFTVASNGTLDLNGNGQVLTNVNLVVGPLGGGQVNVGAGGTLTVIGTVTAHALALGGVGTNGGAAVAGGTLALNAFNAAGGAFQRTFLVNDGAAGNDLTVSSAVVDGTGFQPAGISKTGFGTLQFDGAGANTYTGTTTVNDGTLLLNKAGGAPAMSGPLTVGDGSLQGGALLSDVVRYLAPNQLPDWQVAVTVNGTGFLDLNGFSDAIGSADGQTALTVTSGVVQTGAGTLTVNGDIVFNANFNPGGVTGGTAFVAPVVSGKLNLGSGYARTVTANDRGELPIDADLRADIAGTADLFKQGGGNLLLSGNSAGFSGAVSINSNPGFNQASVTVGSDTALGTGVLFPANQVNLGADGGRRVLANRVVAQDLRLAGGNDLTLAGLVDLTQGATFTVFAPVNFTLAGGVGELIAGQSLNKGGAGTLVVTAPALFSGALTVNGAGGGVTLAGGGTLPHRSSVTVNVGGSLTLDNGAFLDTAAAVVPDRLRNAAAITLAGGGLEFRGNANAAAAEVVGTITASSNFTSTVASVSLGRPTTLTANLLTRNAAGFVSFRGYGADLGSANNRLLFYTPLTPQLSNGALPFATLAKAGDIDFAGYDPVRGVLAAPARTTLVGATAADNVKLTAGQTLGAATAVNALLLVGSNVTVGGTASLLVGSGLLVGDGPGNKVTAPVSFGGAVGLIDVATLARPGAGPSTLDLTGIVDGQAGVNKLGAGRAAFSAANTYAGVTTAAEGVLGVANSGALGAAGDGAAAQGTTVLAGAALELDGSGGNLAVANEALTLSGLGFGYGNTNALVSGNTGALRSLAGTNAWTGPVTLTNAGNNSLVVLGVDAGTLAINAAVGQSANVNVTKAGAGVLEFGGTAANT